MSERVSDNAKVRLNLDECVECGTPLSNEDILTIKEADIECQEDVLCEACLLDEWGDDG